MERSTIIAGRSLVSGAPWTTFAPSSRCSSASRTSTPGTNGPVPRAGARRGPARRCARQLDEGRSGKAFFERLLGAAGRAARRAWPRSLGCDPGELALTGSTTDGVNAVLGRARPRPGRRGADERRGAPRPARAARRRCASGAASSVRVAPVRRAGRRRSGREHEARRLLARLLGDRRGGGLPPRSRPTGVPVLLDGAQGLGAVPVDVRALGCDFYAASGQKWLCGPNGTGYLYVRAELRRRAARRRGRATSRSPTRTTRSSSALHDGRAPASTWASPPPHHVAWALAALDVLERARAGPQRATSAPREPGARGSPSGSAGAGGAARATPRSCPGRSTTRRGRWSSALADAGLRGARPARPPLVRASVGAWTSEASSSAWPSARSLSGGYLSIITTMPNTSAAATPRRRATPTTP